MELPKDHLFVTLNYLLSAGGGVSVRYPSLSITLKLVGGHIVMMSIYLDPEQDMARLNEWTKT